MMDDDPSDSTILYATKTGGKLWRFYWHSLAWKQMTVSTTRKHPAAQRAETEALGGEIVHIHSHA
jgi:hypothetical protein